MTTIGKRISRIRKAQNMSQSTLAQDICSQSNISKIEKGEHIPSFFILSLFAERLNVSPDYLYSGSDQSNFGEFSRLMNRYLEKQQYGLIEEALKDYPPTFFTDHEKKFIYWLKAVVADYNGKQREARKLLVVAEKIHSEINDYILDINILHLKTILFRHEYSPAKINSIFLKIFDHIKRNNIKDNITIKMLLSMSTYSYNLEDFESVIAYSKLAIAELTRDNNMYLLENHLYNYASAMYHVGRMTQKEKEQIEVAFTLAKYNNNKALYDTIITFKETYYDYVMKGVSENVKIIN
ncbi:helix-turn-helix domain-containing protein [Macrococcus bovicus]|uniref:helix-turn-helix domain-containing protein n=1 Tax=Macrococcus bovicus TaxID=69968 RepID=UPI0025A5A387|nr:helix-turn-helix transcriptional regulator [Macrococcus bovicus]WJP96749.1 helix-turn-helix transcriptional regulator [Macrococcus bovicus]